MNVSSVRPPGLNACATGLGGERGLVRLGVVAHLVVFTDPETGMVIASGAVTSQYFDDEGLHFTVQQYRTPDTTHTDRRRDTAMTRDGRDDD